MRRLTIDSLLLFSALAPMTALAQQNSNISPAQMGLNTITTPEGLFVLDTKTNKWVLIGTVDSTAQKYQGDMI